jgi:hypothetical protein
MTRQGRKALLLCLERYIRLPLVPMSTRQTLVLPLQLQVTQCSTMYRHPIICLLSTLLLSPKNGINYFSIQIHLIDFTTYLILFVSVLIWELSLLLHLHILL